MGGFISQNLGWRWAYWIMLMATVPMSTLMFFFMQESNHPTILERKTQRLREELGRDDLRSQLQVNLPPRQVLTRNLVRPIKVRLPRASALVIALMALQFIFKSPIIFMVSLYVATIYGLFCGYQLRDLIHLSDYITDLLLTTIPNVFQEIYHFDVQYTGLAYIACKLSTSFYVSINEHC